MLNLLSILGTLDEHECPGWAMGYKLLGPCSGLATSVLEKGGLTVTLLMLGVRLAGGIARAQAFEGTVTGAFARTLWWGGHAGQAWHVEMAPARCNPS